MVGRGLLWLEFVTLFVVLPAAFRLDWLPLPLFAMLWSGAAYCLVVLLTDSTFERWRLWHGHGERRILAALLPVLLAAPVLLALTWAIDPYRLFAFVRQRPLVWAVVMVLYPILSVYPQGIVYRIFVFHRYRSLFRTGPSRILVSAAAFAFAHIVFRNWIAPTLSLAGGLLFAWTYARTESTLLTAVQHALFGCYLFTIGLGWYFYAGAF